MTIGEGTTDLTWSVSVFPRKKNIVFPAAKFAQLLCVTVTLTPQCCSCQCRIDDLSLSLSEKTYGWAHVRVTSVSHVALCVCIWQVQSPLITTSEPHCGPKVSINHHDNQARQRWDEARGTDRERGCFCSSVCPFDCQGQGCVSLWQPMTHSKKTAHFTLCL